MTLSNWLLLVVIIADLGAFFTWRARMLAAEADIRDLKSNSNKMREASLGLLTCVREIVKKVDAEPSESVEK